MVKLITLAALVVMQQAPQFKATDTVYHTGLKQWVVIDSLVTINPRHHANEVFYSGKTLKGKWYRFMPAKKLRRDSI